MLWHRYPCKCSAQCLWILRALFCTWIVRVVGDHLILRRWWLTHAFISGYAPLWCQRKGERPREEEEEEGRMEWERERKGGKDERKKYKESDRKPHGDERGKSLITMYYWWEAMCRKESSLTLLILSTASFESTKSTLHWQTLSTLLLARQRVEWKEATMYCTIKAASNYVPISSLTTLSFVDIMFN